MNEVIKINLETMLGMQEGQMGFALMIQGIDEDQQKIFFIYDQTNGEIMRFEGVNDSFSENRSNFSEGYMLVEYNNSLSYVIGFEYKKGLSKQGIFNMETSVRLYNDSKGVPTDSVMKKLV